MQDEHMKRTASAVGIAAVLCLSSSLLAAPASAGSVEPDHEVPASLQLTAAEMGAFVALEGAEPPTAWGGDAAATYRVTEDMYLNDRAQFATPYQTTSSTGPVDPTSTTTSTTVGAFPTKVFPIYCRVTMDYPHASHTTSRTVNTHLVGQCPRTPINHSISGSTYRQFWFGWGIQTSGVSSNSKAFNKLVLPFRCHYNQWGLYRSTGRFYSLFDNGYRGISYVNRVANVQCR